MSEVPNLDAATHNSRRYMYLLFRLCFDQYMIYHHNHRCMVINHEYYLFQNSYWVETSIELPCRWGSIAVCLLGCERSVEREFPALVSTHDQNKGLVFPWVREKKVRNQRYLRVEPISALFRDGLVSGLCSWVSRRLACLQPDKALPRVRFTRTESNPTGLYLVLISVNWVFMMCHKFHFQKRLSMEAHVRLLCGFSRPPRSLCVHPVCHGKNIWNK